MKKIYTYCCILSTLFISCKKILDINVNPNSSNTATKDMLLSGALLSSARIETVNLNELGSYWGGYWGKAYDITGSTIGGGSTSGGTASLLEQVLNYSITDNIGSDIWEKSYVNIYNYTLMEEQTQNSSPFYAGIAKIMKGMLYMQLVDHFNNVPFTEASDPTNVKPKYDHGIDVYAGAIELVNSGIQDIKNSGLTPKPTAADIFFHGDAMSWIQFGNTLKLRGLLQQSQLPGQAGYIRTELDKIKAEGSGFLSSDLLANPGFTNQTDDQQNPFYTIYFRNSKGVATNLFNAVRPTRFLLGQYDKVNDPRKAIIYAEASNGGGYKGVLLGQSTADASQNASATSAFRGPGGGVIKTATSGALLFSLAESLFLQAEAAQRNWIEGIPKEFYENGIKASFSYLGIPLSSFSVYNSQANVDFDDVSAGNKIERIISQKWLALNGINGAAAWNDFRRMGFPAGMPNSLAISSPGIYPRRLRYPVSEVNTNNAEVIKQGNIDGLTDKVFWQP